MNEIEKLYKNAGIKPIKQGYCDWDSDCPYPDIINSGCGDECPYWEYEDEAEYPPFTAEKQIELIKWIAHHDGCFKIYLNSIEFGDSGFGTSSIFETAFAKAVNMYLSSATEKEKQQIRKILDE